jgi:aminoglycoside phosphotransferase (APT) family kinase protein
MAIPTTRDRAATAVALARWLEDAVPDGRDATVELHDAPAGTGFSSDTVVFDAAWRGPDGPVDGSFVARLRPTGYTLYQEHDLEKQWRVIDALHRHTAVPVPPIVGHDTSADSPLGQPFFVMERVEGRAPADAPPYTVAGWLHDAAPTDQSALFERGLEVLARIHAVDWEALGLGPLLRAATSPPVGAARQMDHDEQFLGWVLAGRHLPVFEDAVAWLAGHVPDEPELVLNWGDARLGNILFRDFAPVAVLDWEMVTLGAPEADLAWWIVFMRLHTTGINKPELPGFPSPAETVRKYEALAGRPVGDLHFYEVRAALRAGLLLVRFTDALVANGTLPPDAPKTPYTPAGRVLTDLLAAGPADREA